ncbi:uncharacterized protein [Cherax quadricarinatus]
MELSSGGAMVKTAILIGSLVILSGRCCADGDQEKICNPGWELCPTTGNLCVPTSCRGVTLMDLENERCKEGQVYCGHPTNACINPCPSASKLDNPASPTQHQLCEPDLIFCNRTGMCAKASDCENDQGADVSCKMGYSFCPELGGCVMDGCPSKRTGSSVKACPPGTVLCRSTGQCLAEGRCDSVDSSDLNTCPTGQVFCLESSRCTPKGRCEGSRLFPVFFGCASNKEFCLQLGTCVARGQCEPSETSLPAVPFSCPPHQEFCLALGSCVAKGQCEIPVTHWPSASSCPLQYEFCLETLSCKPMGMCKSGEYSPTPASTNCPPFQEFCLETSSCNPKGMCESSEHSTNCPPFQEFCLETSSCKPKGMCESSEHSTTPASTNCPLFQEFCLETSSCTPKGMCKSNEPPPLYNSAVCPPLQEFCLKFGTCVTKGQCEIFGSDTYAVFSCPLQQEFCLQLGTCVARGQCEPLGGKFSPPCPLEYEFCLETSSCAPQGMCKTNDSQSSLESGKCPPSQEFCLKMNMCVPKGECELPGTPLPCPLQYEFCLETSSCTPKGMCESRKLPPLQGSAVCPPLQEFCLKLGSCVDKGQCDQFGSSLPTVLSCPPQQEFCMQLGTCIIKGQCKISDFQLPDSPSSCPPEQEFCMQLGTCVIKGQCKTSGSQLPDGPSSCPPQLEFCLQLGVCVHRGQCESFGSHKSAVSSCTHQEEFCLQLGACVSKGQCGSPRTQLPEPSCPLQYEFCLATSSCIPKGTCRNNELPSSPPSVMCPPLQEFCLELDSCVAEGECKFIGTPLPSPSCPPQHELCLETSSCKPKGMCETSEHLPTPASTRCPFFYEFCAETSSCTLKGMCKTSGLLSSHASNKCPPSQVFCLETSSCIPKGMCESREFPPLPDSAKCPPFQEFCLKLAKCVARGQCDQPGSSPPTLPFCPPQQEFCLQHGTCVIKGQCKLSGSQLPDGPSSCPPQQEFCLHLGTCVIKGQCKISDSQLPDGPSSCPPQQEFCLHLGTCVIKGQCKVSDSQLPDGPSSCPPQQEFCLHLGTCVIKGHCKISDSQLPDGPSSCHPQQEFCLHLGTCVIKGQCKVSDSQLPDGPSSCPPQQEFCLHLGTCVIKGQCKISDSQLPDGPSSCPPQQEFCLRLGTCVIKGHCKISDSQLPDGPSSCPPQQEFCLHLGTCVIKGQCKVSDSQPPDGPSSCPPQQEFCLHLGTCVIKGQCKIPGSQLPATPTTCPPQQEFCLQLGTCVIRGRCGPAESQIPSPSVISCPLPQEFCLQLRTCVFPGNCFGTSPGSPTTVTNCPSGQVFCMSAGSCVLESQCGQAGEDLHPPPPLITTCLPGKLFCLATGTCEPEGGCTKMGSSPGQAKANAAPAEVCPPDKVFCLSSGTCEPAGGCGDRPPETMATMCPRGYIYCMQKGECVSATRGCNEPSSRLGVSCPSGTTFSLLAGACVPYPTDSPDISSWLPDIIKCPEKSEKDSKREPFTYTTCISSQHCPLGFTCCPDPDTLHLQCVDAAGNADKKTINMTCLVVGKARYDTGIVCGEPQDCPIASVCCEGHCRTRKGVANCPLGTLYCPLTRTCQWLGESCAKVCVPESVYCVSTGKCGPKNDCEFVSTSGAPWTLPGPLRVSANNNSDAVDSKVIISEMFKTASPNFGDTPAVVFTVKNLTKWFGTWMHRGDSSSVWVHVEPTSLLTPGHYIRFKPHPQTYAFGLDFINMTETGSGIQRIIVQLVAPELPAVLLADSALRISLKQAASKTLKLSEMVNVTCEDEHYWQAWEQGADLPKEAAQAGLLDYAHPAVISWVRALQQPRLGILQLPKVGDKDGNWQGHAGFERRGGKYSDGHSMNTGDGRRSPKGAGNMDSVERGLKLEWTSMPASRDKVKIYISYSLDDGQTWLTMNPFRGVKLPLSSCEAASNILVRLRPAFKALGSPNLHVSVYSMQSPSQSKDSSETMAVAFQNETDIPLEIEGVNSGPIARLAPDPKQIPTLTYGRSNPGIPAHTYASAFYIDADEGTVMSLLILQAHSSSLGTWQYSLDGATYKDIVGLEKDPFPKKFRLAGSYKGIVKLEEKMEVNECDFSSMIKDSSKLTSVDSSSECLEELKKVMDKYASKSASNITQEDNQNEFSTVTEDNTTEGSGQDKKGIRLPRSTIGQQQFGGFGTGNFNVTTAYPMVTGLLVPANALIKFNYLRDYWTLPEALQKTKLVFTASNNADLGKVASEVKMINFSFVQSWKIEGLDSFAKDPVVMSMEWTDCTGQRLVSNPPQVVDACGVCGGYNTSCLDCNGDLYGSADNMCGMCVGGNTRKTVKLDCAGECGEKNILKEVGSSLVCVPKDQPNVTLCDGTIKSTANINQCGICVEGDTGLKKDSGMDQCNVCFGPNDCVACDGVVNSTVKTNVCGACLFPNDPRWKNCSGLHIVSDPLDACINDLQDMTFDTDRMTFEDLQSFLTLDAEVAGAKSRTHIIDNCSLVNDMNQESPAVAVNFQNNVVRAVFNILLSGKMTLRCAFKSKYRHHNQSMVVLETTNMLTVMDSRAVVFEVDKTRVETVNESVVTLTVTSTSSLDSATCIIIYQPNSSTTGESDKAKERRMKGDLSPHLVQDLPTALIPPNRVTCTLPKDARPGQAQLGLPLTFAARVLVHSVPLKLPTMPLIIKAQAPQVTSAVLSSTGEFLDIIFDVNVESKTQCSQIINWPWTGSTKSPAPICKFSASRLRVLLGPVIRVVANTSLNFTASSNIRRAFGDAATAQAANGSFTVTQPELMNELTFEMTGNTQACNSSLVMVTINRIRGAKIEDITPTWNITWEPGIENWSQADILQTWQSIHALKEKMKTMSTHQGFTMTVPGSRFLPSKKYMVVAQLKTSDGLSSEAKGMTITTMPPDQLLQVTISGSTEVKADCRYKYTATATLCSETESTVDNLKLQYYWSVNGHGVVTGQLIGKSITLPAGILRGGYSYILSATVISDDPSIMGIGQVNLTAVSQGLEVITSTDSLVVGSVSPITIDASKSKDKDNLPGSFSYRWWCRTQDGAGCYTSSGGTLTRLENTLSENELTTATLKIPSAMLPPNRYTLTVDVNKENSTVEKNVTLEIIAGQCALITTHPTAIRINPNKRIRVPTSITGPANIEVQWYSVSEPGFLDADISQLPSGKITKLIEESKERDYDLVIPKPTDNNFLGLVGDAFYKFRIQVKTPLGYSCFSDLQFKTNSPPHRGNFKVLPSSGMALVTNFTFSASYWTDYPEDLPLTTSFGYRLEGNEGNSVAWPFTTNAEDPFTDLILPAESNRTRVIPLVKVCDIYGACTVREGKLLTLALASELPGDILSILITSFEDRMNDDESTKAGLDTISTQLGTLTAMNLQAEAALLMQQVEIIVKEKLSSLSARMSNDVASIVRALNILKGINNLLTQFSASQDVHQKIMDFGRLLSAALIGHPVQEVIPDSQNTLDDKEEDDDDEDAIHYPSNDNQLDAVRNMQNTRFGSSGSRVHGVYRGRNSPVRRVKRSAPPANGTQQLRSMKLDAVTTLLETFEQAIIGAAPEGSNTGDMRELLQNLPKYSSGLCLGMSSQDEPSSFLGSLLAITVQRSDLKNQADTRFFIANSKGRKDDFIQEDSFVIWGNILLQYVEWFCGKKGDDGEALPCYGACLATTMLKDDYLSPTTGATAPGSLRTPVAETFLINTVTGMKIPINMGHDKIIYHLVVYNDTVPKGYQLKCYGWDENEWVGSLCNTGKFVMRGGVKRLRCMCKSPVYVAGFASEISNLPSTSTSTVIETTSSTSALPIVFESPEHAKIIINEDFNEVVGDDHEDFIKLMTKQIATQLKISESRIYNMTVRNGSILVEFDVLPDYTQTSNKTPAAVVEELYDLINSGGLVILGPTKKELKIPPQNINGPVVEEKQDPTKLPIIIGAIVGSIVMIVIVFICVAIYLKNKKRMDKVEPLYMNDSKQPTYSSIHFEQSLDGTVASLVKYRNGANTSNRSLSSGGAYSDEGIYIERRSTANSSRMGSSGSSTGKGSYDSGTGHEIPEAFRYRIPTKEQLERSGPIPEHIIRRIKAESEVLPGTPENLA